MPTRYTLRLAIVSAAVAALSVGCSGSRPGRSAALAASPRPYSPDIPLPEGFRLADQPNGNRSNSAVAGLRHRYEGRAELQAVRDFYLKQMPLVRWTPLDETRTDAKIVMRFSRAGDRCTVTIRTEPMTWTLPVTVDIAIAEMDENSE